MTKLPDTCPYCGFKWLPDAEITQCPRCLPVNELEEQPLLDALVRSMKMLLQRVAIVEEKADHPLIQVRPEAKKPPLGIMPRSHHRAKRILDIRAALRRYQVRRWQAPAVWAQELETLVNEEDKEEDV